MITIADIRAYVKDVTWQDNDLLMDLAFTDEQITQAMKSCVRDWNGIPPYVARGYKWDKLPDDTNVFFDGTVASLLRTEFLNKARNEAVYQAGNMSSNIDTQYINRLKELIQLHEARFKDVASGVKLSLNLNAAYGPLG